jgi:phytoene synthase
LPTALESQVRRVDEDRWLASRFAPADVRQRLVALYALNDEIARSSEVVTRPALADIRLAWWRDAIAEIYAGKPARAHPVLQAFAEARGDWPQAAFEALIDARARDVDTAPFADVDALEAYIDATAGGVLRLALHAVDAPSAPTFAAAGARAWGFTAWLRARRAPPHGADQGSLIARAGAYHEMARSIAKSLAANAFPATGYVALVPGYLRAFERGQYERPLIVRQLRLLAASATGAL